MNITTNTHLLNNLYFTQKKIDTVTNQLSTGVRVNKASDDPSSIVYTTRLTAKINETELRLQSIQKGQFILESMQVGLSSLNRVLSEMESLAQMATNVNLSSTERQALIEPYTYLINTYTDIALNFEVDKVNYLAGNDEHFAGDQEVFSVNTGYGKLDIRSAGIAWGQYEGFTYNLSLLQLPDEAIRFADNGQSMLMTSIQERYGLIQKSLDRYEELNMKQLEIMKKDYSRIMDADTAKATSELARLQILEKNNLMLMQVNDSHNEMLSTLLNF